MKISRYRHILLLLSFMLMAWVLDAFILYRTADINLSFQDSLYSNIPTSDLLRRFTMLLLLLITGLAFISILLKKGLWLRLERKENEYFRLIAENTNDVIWTMSLEGRYLFVSPSITKMLGYTPEELIGAHFETTKTKQGKDILEGLLNRFMEIFEEYQSKTPSVVTELEQLHKNGQVLWTETSITTITSDAGKPLFFLGVSRNISERKKREADLRQSEENYRLLFETTQDYILVHDMEGNISFVNQSCLQFLGYSLDEIKEKSIQDIVSSRYQAYLESLSDKRNQGDLQRFRYEMEVLTREGKEIPLEISSAPIMYKKVPMAMLITARDITERKEAERAMMESRMKIERLNEELEELVKERTADYEEAIYDLEAFSYSISHDLRAPLRQLLRFAELLTRRLDDHPDEKALNYIRLMADSAGKMNVMIEELLKFSRTGRQNVEKKQFSMKELVEEVIREISSPDENGSVEWKIGKMDLVQADRNLLRQVWFNLISNSIKFTGKRSDPVLRVGMRMKNGKKWFFIRDNGAGFDERYKDKLFGVFQRLHSQSEFEGTGIGLANVKRIIEKHGGIIEAEGKVDRGAEFRFYLA